MNILTPAAAVSPDWRNDLLPKNLAFNLHEFTYILLSTGEICRIDTDRLYILQTINRAWYGKKNHSGKKYCHVHRNTYANTHLSNHELREIYGGCPPMHRILWDLRLGSGLTVDHKPDAPFKSLDNTRLWASVMTEPDHCKLERDRRRSVKLAEEVLA